MKHQHKFLSIVFCVLLVLSLMGCGRLIPNTTEPTTASTAPTLATEPTTTQATVSVPTTETTVATAPVTDPSEPTADGSYLVRIPWHGISILSEPVYDAALIRTIEPGTYTIVEEATDYEGNLWGKLKSGLGWIDLTLINAYHEDTPPMIANYASEALLDSGNYHHCVADTSEYAVKVAFYPTEKLTSVAFFSMALIENLARDQALLTIEELTPDKPLVAEISFPGDMSMYEITFTDADGNICTYRLGMSGRNGTLMFYQVNP